MTQSLFQKKKWYWKVFCAGHFFDHFELGIKLWRRSCIQFSDAERHQERNSLSFGSAFSENKIMHKLQWNFLFCCVAIPWLNEILVFSLQDFLRCDGEIRKKFVTEWSLGKQKSLPRSNIYNNFSNIIDWTIDVYIFQF